jgi:hypothetical protein
MRPESIAELEAVAREAARIAGQNYDALPQHARDIWREAVRQTPAGRGQTAVEKAAGRAIEAWIAARQAPIDADIDALFMPPEAGGSDDDEQTEGDD